MPERNPQLDMTMCTLHIDYSYLETSIAQEYEYFEKWKFQALGLYQPEKSVAKTIWEHLLED